MKINAKLSRPLFSGLAIQIIITVFGSSASFLSPAWGIPILLGTLLVVLIISIVSAILRDNRTQIRLIMAASTVAIWADLHLLTHWVRDTIVRSLPPVPDLKAPIVLTMSEETRIGTMLHHIRDAFARTVPKDVRIMVTVREIRANGMYETFQRFGSSVADREVKTNPLSPADATIRGLLDKLSKKQVCVNITGSVKSELEWTPQFNDQFGEDLSVLIGAVQIKNPVGPKMFTFTQGEMKWVLCVCANKPDIFNDDHVPLMRTCIDELSIYANLLARKSVMVQAEIAVITLGVQKS